MQPQGKMPFLDQGGVQIVPLVTPLPSGLQSSCYSLHFGRPCSAAVGAPWLWQSHRFFFGRLLSPATGSQNHGSTLKWQAPSQDSLQAVGAFWRPLASHHPLQTSSSAVPTLQGRGRHLSQQFHQQPRYGKRSLSNLADLLGQVKIPKSYWYGLSMFIFIFAVRLAILGYLVSTFLGQPPIWSFLPDALLQLFHLCCKASARPPGGATASQALYGGRWELLSGKGVEPHLIVHNSMGCDVRQVLKEAWWNPSLELEDLHGRCWCRSCGRWMILNDIERYWFKI